MNKYLVVCFNREESECTTHEIVEAESPSEALYKGCPSIIPESIKDEAERREWWEENELPAFEQVNATFSMIDPGDLMNYLVFKIP